MNEIGFVIVQIFILLLMAKLLGRLFEKMNMPGLVGEILAGVIFINLILFFPEFGVALHFDPDAFVHDETHFLHVMGEIGIIFLLFMVGLETKLGDLVKVGKTATYVAVLGLIIPLLGGFALMLAFDPGNVNLALLIGTAMFAMSTGITIEVFRNMNAMGTKEAKIIIGAAVIDDILCLSLLAIISGIVTPDTNMTNIIINTITVVAFLLLTFAYISRVKESAKRRRERMISKYKTDMHVDGDLVVGSEISDFHEKKPTSELGVLSIAVLVCIGMAALSSTIGLAGIIGAFLAGMIFAEFKDTIPCEQNFNTITAFMLPFFFIFVGMMVRFDNFEIGLMPLLIALIVVAILTKFVGGYVGAKMGKMSKGSSTLVGVSMIPRGEVGIIVASIGLSLGVFTDSMFTVVILMTLATSIVAPPLISWAYKRMWENDHEDPLPDP
jgi:Kef-type K+ transport systems, membrane components